MDQIKLSFNGVPLQSLQLLDGLMILSITAFRIMTFSSMMLSITACCSMVTLGITFGILTKK
jgi:hypothetical protein